MSRSPAIAAIVCALAVTSFAATQWSSDITSNTTWTVSGSPYELWAAIQVNSGATLTIEPGVTVKVRDGATMAYGITATGTVLATGTAANHIVFTRGTTATFGHVRTSTGGTLLLDYCDFTDAAGAGGINGTVDIRHCTFSGGGIYMITPTGTPVVRACSITNPTSSPLDLRSLTSATIDSVTITTGSADTQAVQLASASPTITNSTIRGSGLAPALLLSGNSRPTIDNCVIAGGADYAIYCAAGGDYPILRGDSLSATTSRFVRTGLSGWVVATAAAPLRAFAPSGVAEILASSTSLSGTIPNLCPVRLLGDITFNAAAAITLAPGLVMENGGGTTPSQVTIDGAVSAVGTTSQHITLRHGPGAITERLGAITVNGSLTLDYCDFVRTDGLVFAGAPVQMKHCTMGPGCAGVTIAAPPSAPIVTACTFDSLSTDALALYSSASGQFDSLNIRATTGNAIFIYDASPQIRYSTITTSTGTGILCTEGSHPVIHYDSIAGNRGGGVRNTSPSATIDAEYNWWGDSTGPYHPTLNNTARGDSVSNDVDFTPWLGATTTVMRHAPSTTARLSPTLERVSTFDLRGRALAAGTGRPGAPVVVEVRSEGTVRRGLSVLPR